MKKKSRRTKGYVRNRRTYITLNEEAFCELLEAILPMEEIRESIKSKNINNYEQEEKA